MTINDRSYDDAPKVFWKYYDLFRRNKISMSIFVSLTGIPQKVLSKYIQNIMQEEEKCFATEE